MKIIFLVLCLMYFNCLFGQKLNFDKTILADKTGDTIIENLSNNSHGSYLYTTKSGEPFSGYATGIGHLNIYEDLKIKQLFTYDIREGRLIQHHKTFWVINFKDTLIIQDVYNDPYSTKNYSVEFNYYGNIREYIQNKEIQQQITSFYFYDYSNEFQMNYYYISFNTKKSKYIITKRILHYSTNKKGLTKNKQIFSQTLKYDNLTDVLDYLEKAINPNFNIFDGIRDKFLSCPFSGVVGK